MNRTSLAAAALLLPLLSGPALALPDEAACRAILADYGFRPAECGPVAATMPAGAAVAVAPQAAIPPDPAADPDHIYFRRGGTRMDAGAEDRLRLLARVLDTGLMRGACIGLVGHADAQGAAAANERLSLRRAERVAEVLRARLLDPSRLLEVRGAGDLSPLPGIDPASPLNRRVAILARPCPQATAG
jgi:outer membrane protein OmpA-like peptidoglycan-associated protein